MQDGIRLADQAVSQEVQVKRVLDLLDGLDPAHPDFEPLLRQLIGAGRAHLDFEESRVWPGVRLALSEQELADLGARLEQGKRLAPDGPGSDRRRGRGLARLAVESWARSRTRSSNWAREHRARWFLS